MISRGRQSAATLAVLLSAVSFQPSALAQDWFADPAHLALLTSPPVSSAPVYTNTLNQGLVAYWPNDEASGSHADATGNGHTLSNVGTLADTTGQITNCANYTGHQQLTRSDAAFVSAQSFSFSMWVSLGSTSLSGNFGTWDPADGSFNWVFEENTDSGHAGRWSFVVTGASTALYEAAASSTVTANTWHLVAGGYDSTNQVVWISLDGGTKATTAMTEAPETASIPINFDSMSASGGADQLQKLDDAGYWNRVLSAAELADLFNRGKNGTQGYPWDGDAPTPTLLVQNSGYLAESAANTSSTKSQSIVNSTAYTIYSVAFLTEDNGATAHVEIWDSENFGGTKHGGNSDSQATYNGYGMSTFTWSSNAPQVTGSFCAHLVVESGSTYVVYTADAISGNGYSNASQLPSGRDWGIEIYVLP